MAKELNIVGDKFKVGRKLGSGAFGEVHLGNSNPRFNPFIGTNITTKEEVAIKIVRPSPGLFELFRSPKTQNIPSCSMRPNFTNSSTMGSEFPRSTGLERKELATSW
jgi:serine/threonine protein kinase